MLVKRDLENIEGGDEGGSKLNAHQQVLVVCHVHMYKVPFILQFNFEYMKKEREKLKLSSSKDFFFFSIQHLCWF